VTEGEATTQRRWPSAYGIVLVGAVAVRPFLGFAAANESQIRQIERVLIYATAAVALAVSVLAVVTRLLRGTERDRTAVVVATVVAAIVNYSTLFDPDPAVVSRLAGVLVFWLLLSVLAARLALIASGSDHVRFAALVFAATMVVLSAGSWAIEASRDAGDVPVTRPGRLDRPKDRPNVYWFVLDGYSRPDVLERVAGFDDGPFVEALEDRGFDVSLSSLTSYPRTHLSLASTLQMDYVLEPGHDVTDDYGRFAPVFLGRNNTAARFRALGYDTVYAPAGGAEWAACRPDLVDVCLEPIRPRPAVGELEQALLDLTPLGVIELPAPYADPVTFVQQLARQKVSEPFFAFQHILTPHEPYRYREDCTPRTVPTSRRGLSGPEQIEAYVTDVRCLNDRLLEGIDRIVARDPEAVILVQSDHGSDFSFSWAAEPSEWGPAKLQEKLGAFNAMRLPADCPIDIEGEPLVNTYRIVFSCIERTEAELLEYRGFIQPLDDVLALSEVDPDVLLESDGATP
jgi:hypothetical protein